MNNLKKTTFPKVGNKIIICLGILILLTVSCSKMDDPYKDFWKDGEIVYPAVADSVMTYPGKNRIKLKWILRGDASIKNAKVFWDSGRDSISFPVTPTGGVDTLEVLLSDMPAGFYVFDIIHIDNKGNSSLTTSAVSDIYGNNYGEFLLNRTVDKAFFDDDTLEVSWQNNINESTFIGSQLAYVNKLGEDVSHIVESETSTTLLSDYDFSKNSGVITSQSMYLPEPNAIDTFYTAIDTVKVLRPPMPLPRGDWTVTATSVNDPFTSPKKTLDGDPSSFWWTGPFEEFQFPFILTIDMGQEINTVDGVFLKQRLLENPHLRMFEVQVSSNGTEWESLGTYTAEDNTEVQHFDFMTSESFRYFKVICNSTYRNTPRCSLAEVGVYQR